MRTKKYLSKDEKELEKKIEQGKIIPVDIPRLVTSTDILKYQLCSEIIKFKNEKEFSQNDIAKNLEINKSEVSKLFGYKLNEFSTDRLLNMIETLVLKGADIRFEDIFEQVKKRVVALDKKIRSKSVTP